MKGQPTEIWQIYNKANSTLEIPQSENIWA